MGYNRAQVTAEEWKSYSRKEGWSLLLKKKTRTIVYLGPCKGCIRVSLVLGDKAIQFARNHKLPPTAAEALESSILYPEGTGIYLFVKTCKALEEIKTLILAQPAN